MKVIDCVMFFNELDLLDVRLHELDSVVDQVNIIESTMTFQGREKPLNFYNNRDRYKKFANKINYFVFEGDQTASVSWHREYSQREFSKKTVENESLNTRVIITDMDEIPSAPSVIKGLGKEIVFFEMTNFYYYMDWASDIKFVQAMMTSVEKLRTIRDLSQLRMDSWTRRFEPGRYEVDLIADAGWHLSWLGGVDVIMEKLASFSHTEPEAQRHADREHIRQCIDSQIFFEEHDLKAVAVAELPDFVQSNEELLREKGLLSPGRQLS